MREQELEEDALSHGGFELVKFCENARAHALIFNKIGALWYPCQTRSPTDSVGTEKASRHPSMQNESPMPKEVALVPNK